MNQIICLHFYMIISDPTMIGFRKRFKKILCPSVFPFPVVFWKLLFFSIRGSGWVTRTWSTSKTCMDMKHYYQINAKNKETVFEKKITLTQHVCYKEM